MTPAEKARAMGLDEGTIRQAYADFTPEIPPMQIHEAHYRVIIYAAAYDQPTGNVYVPWLRAGIVRP